MLCICVCLKKSGNFDGNILCVNLQSKHAFATCLCHMPFERKEKNVDTFCVWLKKQMDALYEYLKTSGKRIRGKAGKTTS